MDPCIKYRARSLATLLLEIDPRREFRAIVDDIEGIGYPALAVNPELVSFALLELISNSVRAHHERGVAEPVRLSLEVRDSALAVTVLDSGRGFDPARLPYDLDEPAERIDLMSDAFARYRDAHGGSRFGMGLYTAKKTFRDFRLSFVDREGRRCPWYSGAVRGTRVELAVPYAAALASDADRLEELEALEEVEEVSDLAELA